MIRMDMKDVELDPSASLSVRFVGDLLDPPFPAPDPCRLRVAVGPPGLTDAAIFDAASSPIQYVADVVELPREVGPFDVTQSFDWLRSPASDMSMYLRGEVVGNLPRTRLTYVAIVQPDLDIKFRGRRVAFT